MKEDDPVKDGDTIVVWFSCGAASAVAAKKTIERYGKRCCVRVVNNPIAEEDEDNLRFLADVEKWLGVNIERSINPKYPSCSAVEVWEKRKYMSGVKGAPCTYELKKQARQEWERYNRHDWLVLGFTADEQKRFDRFVFAERENTLPVLTKLGITKQDCFEILKREGIRVPRMYAWGYPNANCIGCVKSASPGYWSLVRKTHPEVFAHRCEQSRHIGAKLIKLKGKRVFLDELPADVPPVALKGKKVECGIFCETKFK